MRPSGIAKALRTPMFRCRVVKAKKGKGSYSRKCKQKDEFNA